MTAERSLYVGIGAAAAHMVNGVRAEILTESGRYIVAPALGAQAGILGVLALAIDSAQAP